MTIELKIIVYKLRGDILLLSNDILKIVHILSGNHFETCMITAILFPVGT